MSLTLVYQRIREATAQALAGTRDAVQIDGALAEAIDPESLDGLRDAVWRAWRKANDDPDAAGGTESWIEELYEDVVIAREGDNLYRVPYTVAEDNTVTFGEREKVKVVVDYTPLEDATEATRTTEVRTTGVGILESLDESGWIWRVTLVRPGTSKNRRHYSPEVLAEAIELYEGAKAFDGHRDTATRNASAVGNMVGWYTNVTAATDGSLQADFHIAESAPQIRALFLSAWKNNRPDLVGFSHDVGALLEPTPTLEAGQSVTRVKKIVTVNSVDIVADPSAGGRLERLVASRQEDINMTLADFLRRFRAGEITEAQLNEHYEAHPEWREIAEAVSATESTGGGDPDPTPTSSTTQVTEAGTIDPLTRSLLIREAFTQHNLPQAAQDSLRESLIADEADPATIERRVAETASIWAAALAGSPSPLPGQRPRVEGGGEAAADLTVALDGLIMGEAQKNEAGNTVRPFRGIKEAYSAFTGRHPYDNGDEDFNRWVLAESVGAVPYAGAQRLTEALTSASWAEALGDSITRRLIREYNLPALTSWRLIVSDTGPITDFRTNHRMRIGGYDVLPVVAEGAPYTALTSPTDEEATYAISKKGGTEDYTLEMVANDDVQALRRIPRALGRAAALTLYRAIWNTTIAGNAVIYDGNPLFDALHGNTTAATVLGEAGIGTLRNLMMAQQNAGETSGFLGAMPRYLVVPPELYVEAYKLTQSGVSVAGSGDQTTPNPWRGLVPIEVPTLTDANDWYLVADPSSVPTIEVGFYQGREDPELFLQDQPTLGAVFTHDKFTWKIRHIWGLTVLDYRGFQRATNV